MIDFSTGMTLNSLESDPKPYPLRHNHKGHYVLDIRQFLTNGLSNDKGHPRIHVRGAGQRRVNDCQVLEFHTLHVQLDSPEHDCLRVEHAPPDTRTVALMMRLRSASAQMLATQSTSDIPVFGATSESHCLHDPGSDRARPGNHGPAVKDQGGGPEEEGCQGIRRDPQCPSGSSGSSKSPGPVAMLRPTSAGQLICNLRLSYIPRKGSPANSTQIHNPGMVARMLKELQDLMGDVRPTSEICLATQEKINAEEKLLHKIQLAKSDSKKAASSTATSGMNSKSKERPAQWFATSTTHEPHDHQPRERHGFHGSRRTGSPVGGGLLRQLMAHL